MNSINVRIVCGPSVHLLGCVGTVLASCAINKNLVECRLGVKENTINTS